jgi:hypothetical protein
MPRPSSISPGLSTEKADHARRQDDEREGHVEEENGDKTRPRQRLHHAIFQGPLADALDRLQHDRQHRRLEPEKQRGDESDPAEGRIDDAEDHDGDRARQDEQPPGHDPAKGPVH